MSMTLLELIDQVSGELGLAQPATVAGSAINQTMQFMALTTRFGKDLVREFEWNALTKVKVFQTTAAATGTATTTAGSTSITGMSNDATALTLGDVVTGVGIPPYAEVVSIDTLNSITITVPATETGTPTLTYAHQDYALPSDFDRMIGDTNWDRTNHWRNRGAVSSQSWQGLSGGLIAVGPRISYRIFNKKLRIFPAVTSVYNLSFEYVSDGWVLSPLTTAAQVFVHRNHFTADDEVALFPDDLMLAGIKYYFLKAKKLDFITEMAEFLEILAIRKAQDQPSSVKSLAPVATSPFISEGSIPEGNWNL